MSEIEALSGDPNFMTSLARGLAVIRAFSEQRKAKTIAQLSQATGIPRAAVRRCLYTLAKLGYATAEDNHFSLQPKIMSLGHAYLASTPLSMSAQPYLDGLCATVGESCSVSILDHADILYLARSSTTSHILSIDLRAGSRLPAYCTSMGRILLAYLPAADLRAYWSQAQLVARTERTVTSKDELTKIFETVRQGGYAVVDQELEIGLRSIAVPIKNRKGAVIAAMNIGAHANRVTVREMEKQFLPPLVATATELGSLLST